MKKGLFKGMLAAPWNGRRGLGAGIKTVVCLPVGLFLSVLPALRAQVSDQASVYMTGKVCRNEVWLRWSASTPEWWERSLEYGWILERYDFDTLEMGRAARENLTYTPKRKVVEIPPFLLVDTARIAAMADSNLYAAVLGEAVYNPDIALSTGGIALSPWNNISKEMERKQMRFVLANLAYDRSFEVACLGKTGYVDPDVEKGHHYLYRLYVNTAGNTTETSDTALFFTRMESGRLLPPVQEMDIESGYLLVRLKWDIRLAERQSVGYYVERAAGTRKNKEPQYIRLNRTPISVLQENERYRMSYSDSLPDSQNRYAYRVLGVDLFGEEFVVARSRFIKSGAMPLAVAEIDSVTSDTRGKRYIHWSYPEDKMLSVKGFSVYVAPSPDWDVAKSTLLGAHLSPATRRLAVGPEELEVSSYFYIKTEGVDGTSTLSRAYFYWKIDSVPPLPPTGLSYTIDSLGIACISWSPSVDADLSGYRVFRQTEKNAEPVQVTTGTLTDTSFFDTISLNTLQSFFYSVRAVDASGNLSEPSALLAVRNLLPDKPAPAVFSCKSRRQDDRIELVWYNSQTSNIRGHLLLYRCDSSSWFPLKDFPARENERLPETASFIFKFPERLHATRYTFNIVAYGSDKQKDTVNTPFDYTVEYIPEIKPPAPFALVDAENRYIQLQWKEKTGKALRKMYLYRRSENDKLRLLATLDAETAREGYYTDFSVRMNTVYAYVIQYEYEDGLWSAYSAPCLVDY